MKTSSTTVEACTKCDVLHDPARCQAHAKATGKQCGRAPKPGATVCSKHGASAPQVANAAARNVAMDKAVRQLKLGGKVVVDPAEAMLDQVREAAANVEVYRYLVALLRPNVEAGVGELEGDLIDGTEDENGEIAERSMDDIDRSELGGTIAGRIDPANWKAAPHVYVVMYDSERERLMRFAKMCRDAGVEEHRIRMAENLAGQLVDVQTAVLAGFLALIRRAMDQGGLTEAGLRELERSEVPRLIRGVIEATVLERPA